MASNTCSKIVDDRIDKQDRTISQMQEELQQVRFDFVTGMTGVLDRLDQLLFKITNMNATLEQQQQNPDVSAPSPVRDLNVGSTSFETAKGCDVKPLRIEVPRFNGIDPQSWIFKIQQYFDYHRVGEEERLKVAPFYFDEKALAWFRWRNKNTRIQSWIEFLQSLLVHFGQSELEDYQRKVAKLMQTRSVLEYQEEFENLSNKVDDLSESFLMSCIISGLKPSIQHEVASFQPTTLTKAMALAKIQEIKLQQFHNTPSLFSPYPPILPTPPIKPNPIITL